jgi:hypothetical protein
MSDGSFFYSYVDLFFSLLDIFIHEKKKCKKIKIKKLERGLRRAEEDCGQCLLSPRAL